MRDIRIYYPGQLQTAAVVALDDSAISHIRVLRLQAGDSITLFNGQGGAFQAILQAVTRQQVTALIGSYLADELESPLKIHLGQVISRGEKMDITIQKAVELGVAEISPLFSERCGVKLDKPRLAKKMEHWRGIIVSACEQSGRNDLPLLHFPQLLSEWLQKQAQTSALNLSLAPRAQTSLTQLQQQFSRLTKIGLLIGPEGGLSDAELQHSAQQGFSLIKLGPRILRTETAGLAVMAILQNLWGDLA